MVTFSAYAENLGKGSSDVTGWVKPGVIVGVLGFPIAANLVDFRAKRRDDRATVGSLDERSSSKRLAIKQYQQFQNIEQILHGMVPTLFALLAALRC